jgi:hypothetical protein
MGLRIAIACALFGAIVLPLAWTMPALDFDSLGFAGLRDHGIAGPFFLDRQGGPDGDTASWVAHGAFPWTEDANTWEVFLRPLGGALFSATYAVFGHAPIPFYTEIVVLFWGLIAVCAVLFHRVGLATTTALLALLVFASDDMHVEGSIFIASSVHVIPASILSLLGLVAHVRWREGWRPGAWIAPACWVLAMACSEYNLSGLAFVLAFELVGVPSLARRFVSVLPAALLAIGYVAFYKAAGFGPTGYHDTMFHADPFRHPIQGLRVAGENLAWLPQGLLGLELGSIPSALVLALVVPFAVFGVRSRPQVERRSILALMLGACLSLGPVITSRWRLTPDWVSDRNLLLFGIAVALFWTVALMQAYQWLRHHRVLAVRIGSGVMLAAMTYVVFVVSPIKQTRQIRPTAEFIGGTLQPLIELTTRAHAVCGSRPLIYLQADTNATTIFQAEGLVAKGSEWKAPLVMPAFGGETRLRGATFIARRSARQLEMRGQLLAVEEFWRVKPPVGMVIRVPNGTLRVLTLPAETDADMSVEVTFDADLEALCFLIQRGTEPVPVTIPPVGGSREIPSPALPPP